MSYANNAYWQAKANQCKQYADEGACLARISRRVPVTIVPGFGGLGQASLGVTTLAARSPQLVLVQRKLIDAGVLSLRTADGVISATSPTLAALQRWATDNGLSATGVARTSTGGLTIPRELLAAVITSGATPRTGDGGGGATPGKGGGAQETFATPPVTQETFTPGGLPTWAPYAAAGVAALALIGLVLRFR